MDKILIIDDEASICSSLSFALEDEFIVTATTDPKKGIQYVKDEEFHLCLLDLKIGNVNGIHVLEELKGIQNDLIVIMITAYGTISTSVEALQNGAYSYITKPINIDELFSTIKQALHYRKLNNQVHYLSNELEKKYRYEEIIAKSNEMDQVFSLIDKVKDVDTNVLITGESGTGKELVARAIHFSGKRKTEHIEVLNCGAIPEQLLESELFGHEKGAFTGAISSKEGKFQLSQNGTIFLDEIGDMPLSLQVKLLRVLQLKEVTPLGSNKPIKLNVRLLAATNKDLLDAVRKGEFREDLYFRLNVVEIHLPPLRKRKEDLNVLIYHFIDKMNKELQKQIKGLTPKAEARLLAYNYPGNIRELSNVIESAIVISEGPYIDIADLPPPLREFDVKTPSATTGIGAYLGLPLKTLEKEFIIETLKYNNNHKKNTAEMLGISERSLRDKLKQYKQE
ncbi:sigma-54-dependent Fis family transcriptional regulator [Anaerobacillus arseniciselenatis]|uniref:Sigma-54-dependent Fis family transcriptional regulator n=1 Tax=Anaerobacillus arseniciselenatis TaxID=85682 RepID=A0A1S2L753_9BACI|nr:sigma-54 dependent transcriptional regulator [Anaerobacillus arseniciselenatis]OIJ08176.1 sigma-54-dependent Fis family transcriptional regulator [Anaerobacillus arseniciselenatis]